MVVIFVVYLVMITETVWSLHEGGKLRVDPVVAAALVALNSQNFYCVRANHDKTCYDSPFLLEQCFLTMMGRKC